MSEANKSLADEYEDKLNEMFGERKWHCDDIWQDNDGTYPACVWNFLDVERAPAVEQLHRQVPSLYAMYKDKRVRITMASRFGDVGITRDLTRSNSYMERVFLPELTDFDAERKEQAGMAPACSTVDHLAVLLKVMKDKELKIKVLSKNSRKVSKFLVAECMKESRGKGNPTVFLQLVNEHYKAE